MDCSIALDRVS